MRKQEHQNITLPRKGGCAEHMIPQQNRGAWPFCFARTGLLSRWRNLTHTKTGSKSHGPWRACPENGIHTRSKTLSDHGGHEVRHTCTAVPGRLANISRLLLTSALCPSSADLPPATAHLLHEEGVCWRFSAQKKRRRRGCGGRLRRARSEKQRERHVRRHTVRTCAAKPRGGASAAEPHTLLPTRSLLYPKQKHTVPNRQLGSSKLEWNTQEDFISPTRYLCGDVDPIISMPLRSAGDA